MTEKLLKVQSVAYNTVMENVLLDAFPDEIAGVWSRTGAFQKPLICCKQPTHECALTKRGSLRKGPERQRRRQEEGDKKRSGAVEW